MGCVNTKSQTKDHKPLPEGPVQKVDPRLPFQHYRQVFSLKNSWKPVSRVLEKAALSFFIQYMKNNDYQRFYKKLSGLDTEAKMRDSEVFQDTATRYFEFFDEVIQFVTEDNKVDLAIDTVVHTAEAHSRIEGFHSSFYKDMREPFLCAVRRTLDDRYTEKTEELMTAMFNWILLILEKETVRMRPDPELEPKPSEEANKPSTTAEVVTSSNPESDTVEKLEEPDKPEKKAADQEENNADKHSEEDEKADKEQNEKDRSRKSSSSSSSSNEGVDKRSPVDLAPLAEGENITPSSDEPESTRTVVPGSTVADSEQPSISEEAAENAVPNADDAKEETTVVEDSKITENKIDSKCEDSTEDNVQYETPDESTQDSVQTNEIELQITEEGDTTSKRRDSETSSSSSSSSSRSSEDEKEETVVKSSKTENPDDKIEETKSPKENAQEVGSSS